MFDPRTRLAASVVDEVRRHFGAQVLRTAIPRSVRIAEAPSYGQTVLTYDPGSAGALSLSRGCSGADGAARGAAAARVVSRSSSMSGPRAAWAGVWARSSRTARLSRRRYGARPTRRPGWAGSPARTTRTSPSRLSAQPPTTPIRLRRGGDGRARRVDPRGRASAAGGRPRHHARDVRARDGRTALAGRAGGGSGVHPRHRQGDVRRRPAPRRAAREPAPAQP